MLQKKTPALLRKDPIQKRSVVKTTGGNGFNRILDLLNS